MRIEPSWVLFRPEISGWKYARPGPAARTLRGCGLFLGQFGLEDDDAPSRYVVMRETAPKLSIATETLRRSVEQAEVDTGKKLDVPTYAQEESASSSVRMLQLRRGNEILKTASAFSQRARPPYDEMIAYIDMFRDRFGVGSICRVLGATDRGFITSRGYRAAKARPASHRA